MLHYNPRHVSRINMPIFRTNCIITTSGIVTLCNRLYSMPDALQSALIRHTVQPFTESYDTRCDNTICPPEDEHYTFRNTSKIIM